MNSFKYFIGIGCRRGCSIKSLQALLQQTLRQPALLQPTLRQPALLQPALADSGLSIEKIEGIASIDSKKDEAGLLELSEKLSIPLSFFPAEHLHTSSAEVNTPSDTVFDAVGTASVAEASALALAKKHSDGRAELVGTKQKNADATCALARIAID